MIKHLIRTALRFLKHNRLFTGINTFGLSLALAVAFMILLFVINEISYNHCHENLRQVYRVNTYLKEFGMTEGRSPCILAPTLKNEFPQVQEAVSERYIRGFRVKQGDGFVPVPLAMGTSSGIFQIFTLPWLEGPVSEDPLRDRNAIVLTEALAAKLFPEGDALGEEIETLIENEEQLLVVTGVVRDLPKNTTFRSECFVNGHWAVQSLNKALNTSDIDQQWDRNFWQTWILLDRDSDHRVLEEQIREWGKKYHGEDPLYVYALQKLSDVYLHSEDIVNSGRNGDLKNIRLFSIIALLILLIAAINYITLSMAVSSRRTREIGIRKMAGACISSIRRQLFGESIGLATLSLPLSVLLMWPLMSYAEKLFRTSLDLIRANLWIYVLLGLLIVILIGILSGAYASSYLSRLRVMQIIRGGTGFGRRRRNFRSLLVIIQLLIFCGFVSGTMIIGAQYRYALNQDTGHERDHIIEIFLGRGFNGYHALMEGIQSHPEVLAAAGVKDGLPRRGFGIFMQDHFQDRDKRVKMEGISVDYGAIELLGIPIVAGRGFSPDFGGDLAHSALINETAVRELGMKDPLGQTVGGKTVVGVVGDFNLHSIHTEIPPVIISLTDKYIRSILVLYQSAHEAEIITLLKQEWEKLKLEQPFQYAVMENLFLAAYDKEKKLKTILTLSSLFAVLIAMFGLFGMTLYMARSRTREIGIRKVLGSSEASVVALFLRSFSLQVLIAWLVSIPFSIYFTSGWLDDFAYRTGIHWTIFIYSLVMALMVVLPTVYIHARKASRVNPVAALRWE